MTRYRATTVSVAGLAMLAAVLLLVEAPQVNAHCQVPCGIYDDMARIARLHEDADTIGKAMTKMADLAGGHDAQALNQGARWVATKETHASHVIQVVSEYFLTQKVKPVAAGADGYDGYLKKLADHHAVMVAAMKAKQNADASFAEKLHHAIDAMAKHYGK